MAARNRWSASYNATVSLEILCKWYSRLMLLKQNSAYAVPILEDILININIKNGLKMKKANVTAKLNGVKITFSGAIQKQSVVEMVERCQTGKCDCMSDESKEKIKDMSIGGEDGNVELNIEGDLDVNEIQEAVSKSPLIK